ncbi:hypothetical protein BT63DRAFT_466641 [Microthyrium microscopicum]|uniref:Uncharacterized protein n=1 Tax=Microthyrium microscopicum TaxID=703497 RepID=A0A6A6UMZ4_9PEZI|nr:hypothetical protein BT63DRAFT_466641 [Microthyrium microscopicum]
MDHTLRTPKIQRPFINYLPSFKFLKHIGIKRFFTLFLNGGVTRWILLRTTTWIIGIFVLVCTATYAFSAHRFDDRTAGDILPELDNNTLLDSKGGALFKPSGTSYLGPTQTLLQSADTIWLLEDDAWVKPLDQNNNPWGPLISMNKTGFLALLDDFIFWQLSEKEQELYKDNPLLSSSNYTLGIFEHYDRKLQLDNGETFLIVNGTTWLSRNGTTIVQKDENGLLLHQDIAWLLYQGEIWKSSDSVLRVRNQTSTLHNNQSGWFLYDGMSCMTKQQLFNWGTSSRRYFAWATGQNKYIMFTALGYVVYYMTISTYFLANLCGFGGHIKAYVDPRQSTYFNRFILLIISCTLLEAGFEFWLCLLLYFVLFARYVATTNNAQNHLGFNGSFCHQFGKPHAMEEAQHNAKIKSPLRNHFPSRALFRQIGFKRSILLLIKSCFPRWVLLHASAVSVGLVIIGVAGRYESVVRKADNYLKNFLPNYDNDTLLDFDGTNLYKPNGTLFLEPWKTFLQASDDVWLLNNGTWMTELDSAGNTYTPIRRMNETEVAIGACPGIATLYQPKARSNGDIFKLYEKKLPNNGTTLLMNKDKTWMTNNGTMMVDEDEIGILLHFGDIWLLYQGDLWKAATGTFLVQNRTNLLHYSSEGWKIYPGARARTKASLLWDMSLHRVYLWPGGQALLFTLLGYVIYLLALSAILAAGILGFGSFERAYFDTRRSFYFSRFITLIIVCCLWDVGIFAWVFYIVRMSTLYYTIYKIGPGRYVHIFDVIQEASPGTEITKSSPQVIWKLTVVFWYVLWQILVSNRPVEFKAND